MKAAHARQDNATPPTLIKRTVLKALLSAQNQWLGTPLGWLHLNGEVNTAQFSAGITYAGRRVRYDRVMGFPRRTARVMGVLNNDFGSYTEEEAVEIRFHFDRLHEVLSQSLESPREAGRLISILDDVCVDLQFPAWADRATLRLGLDQVNAVQFGKKPQRKAVARARS